MPAEGSLCAVCMVMITYAPGTCSYLRCDNLGRMEPWVPSGPGHGEGTREGESGIAIFQIENSHV